MTHQQNRAKKTDQPQPQLAGRKKQISLTIAPALLAKVDSLASQTDLSRTALINLAIARAVEHGLVVDGLKSSK